MFILKTKNEPTNEGTDVSSVKLWNFNFAGFSVVVFYFGNISTETETDGGKLEGNPDKRVRIIKLQNPPWSNRNLRWAMPPTSRSFTSNRHFSGNRMTGRQGGIVEWFLYWRTIVSGENRWSKPQTPLEQQCLPFSKALEIRQSRLFRLWLEMRQQTQNNNCNSSQDFDGLTAGKEGNTENWNASGLWMTEGDNWEVAKRKSRHSDRNIIRLWWQQFFFHCPKKWQKDNE